MFKKPPGLVDIAGAIFVLTMIFINRGFFSDPGVGWHLKTGEFISSSLIVPETDPFLFTSEGKSWVANQWLSDVLFYQVHRIGGFVLLRVFCVLLIFLAFFVCLYPLLLRANAPPLVTLGVWLVCLFQSSVQWFCRPVLFSFLFFAVVFSLLHSLLLTKRSDSILWILPVVFALWSNLHPGFVLGLFLVVLYVAISLRSSSKKKVLKSLVLVAFCFLATLLNPYGIKLHSNILMLGQSEYFMNLNSEWLGVSIDKIYFFPFIFLVCLVIMRPVTARVAGKIRENANVFSAVSFFVFTLMSFLQVRYLPFFSIIAGVVVLETFANVSKWENSQGKINRLRKAFFLIGQRQALATKGLYTGILLSALLLFFSFSAAPERLALTHFGNGYPLAIADYLKAERSEVRLFHSPDFGGFLTYVMYPRLVFIDDRNELNGEAIYEEYFEAIGGRPGWNNVFAKYNFNFALIRSSDPLHLLLARSSDWRMVHKAEPDFILYERATEI